LGEAPRDFRLADARGPDHQDVFRIYVVLKVGRQSQPAPAISNRNGHGPLGIILPDDVAIERFHNLSWRQIAHASFPNPPAIRDQGSGSPRTARVDDSRSTMHRQTDAGALCAGFAAFFA
jgi:hypothetical protein